MLQEVLKHNQILLANIVFSLFAKVKTCKFFILKVTVYI